MKEKIINFWQQNRSEIREWTDSILIAFVLAMFIRTFFIQAFKIPSGSMRMTLLEGDRLMVNKLRYGPMLPFTNYRFPGFSHVQRGDIIVFKYPEDPKRDFIKRVIGLPGEKVEIKDGRIYINDQIIEDIVIKRTYYYNRGTYGENDQPIFVPKGHFYVLGDNSPSSSDSRFWGFVPKKNVLGKAIFRWWPPKRIGLIR